MNFSNCWDFIEMFCLFYRIRNRLRIKLSKQNHKRKELTTKQLAVIEQNLDSIKNAKLWKTNMTVKVLVLSDKILFSIETNSIEVAGILLLSVDPNKYRCFSIAVIQSLLYLLTLLVKSFLLRYKINENCGSVRDKGFSISSLILGDQKFCLKKLVFFQQIILHYTTRQIFVMAMVFILQFSIFF